VNPDNSSKKSLLGKTLYIPRMSIEGVTLMAAAYRALGVNGQPVPESDDSTLELARKYTIGEECYPEIVTLGGFLKVLLDSDFDPAKTAFLMPTAGGPCRFGQYKNLFEKILQDKGLDDVLVVAPTSDDGYEGMGGSAGNLIRLGWWAVVCADAVRKLLLQTRPYEINIGETDRIHQAGLEALSAVIERQDLPMKEKFRKLVDVLARVGEQFARIPANYSRTKPLVGVVGEIYCRLDDFTNSDLIRVVEKQGGECWLASISEWVFYTNFMQKYELTLKSRFISKAIAGSIIRNKIQIHDEHQLLAGLHKRFKGYDEPENIKSIAENALPYLPYYGALGEMVLNVGGAIHYYKKGADGVIDISPFTCMNGIVCEAMYPRVSQDHEHVPIRSFYFDGTQTDLDRDVEIFLELAHSYKKRKKINRVYPTHFQ
jgi:predicted nucleotide-binding protein (sugar kinase/HSP70/actin superfamily)